jgi:acetyl esterase
MSKTPMAQPMRALLGLVNGLIRLRAMPGLEAMLAKTEEQRWGTTIPGVMFRKTNPAIQTEDVLVEARDGHRIPVRVYQRPGTPENAPGYLFIHGGGFIDGGVAHCDHVCRELADRSGFVVVGLSYRLAPQHPFPTGLEDCQDVLTWMHKERPGDLDGERIAVGGESAGGNLTVALSLWARDNNGPRIAHQTPIYPLTDFGQELLPWSEGVSGNPGLNPEVWEQVGGTYVTEADRKNPLASVRFADHTGLPPALVVTCGHDILRDQGVALAESYRTAGVDTKHLHFAELPHGYLLMTRLTKRAYETMDAMIAEAGKHL